MRFGNRGGSWELNERRVKSVQFQRDSLPSAPQSSSLPSPPTVTRYKSQNVATFSSSSSSPPSHHPTHPFVSGPTFQSRAHQADRPRSPSPFLNQQQPRLLLLPLNSFNRSCRHPRTVHLSPCINSRRLRSCLRKNQRRSPGCGRGVGRARFRDR